MIVQRTLRWMASISLVVLMYAYAMFQGGFVSWFLFYSVAPLIMYAWLIGLFPLKTIKVRRILSEERRFAGQRIQVTLKITKPAFPLFYLVVEDQTSLKLQNHIFNHSNSKMVFFPLFKRSVTFTYTVSNLPRGKHDFYRVLVKTGDLFGFVQKQAEIIQSQTLTVYPNIEKIDWQSTKMQSPKSTTIGVRNTSEVVGIRDYIPGDRLTWIDWKSTAKRNKLVAKVFERYEDEDAILIFDDSKFSYQNRSLDLFEQVVTVTASLIAEMERKNCSYMLPFLLEQNRKWLEALATVEATRDVSFPEYVNQMIDQFSTKRSQLVIVTAHVSEELVALLQKLASQNYKMNCFFIAPAVSNVRLLQSVNIAVHLIRKRKGE